MYRIRLQHIEATQEYEELIKLFLRPEQYCIITDQDQKGGQETAVDWVFTARSDKNELKREIFQALHAETGIRPPWGILTGIRPVKMTGELLEQNGSDALTRNILQERFLLTEEKADLALQVIHDQKCAIGLPPAHSAGVYIGIPFCPTRCLYCSFPSNQVGSEEYERYLTAMHREIEAVGTLMRERGIEAESMYLGGGTPTSLSAGQLDRLLQQIRHWLNPSDTLQELTVEAGRPDTVTPEKLHVLKAYGVDRISINPQTMQDRTLIRIGRNHTTAQTCQAFALAKAADIPIINMDLIAGLPGESEKDLRDTLEQVLAMRPENITMHSLAVKRSSRLAEEDKNFHYRQGTLVSDMLNTARCMLREAGYRPYYLYRQKHMSGAQENTGYALPGTENRYNIRIMDEHQHILALGAGGISKVYFPEENRLERVPNVTNYEIYIERIEEMIRRKQHAY